MAVDMFLKIAGDPYKGESKDSKHAEEIDVMSWSWGESNSGTFGAGGGGGAGKVNFNDVSFMIKTCKASPNLASACATGEHIDEATLTCRKAGKEQQEFLIIKFTQLLVSSYQVSASSEDPVESISFNFAKIEMSYKPQKKDGTLDAAQKFTYDIEEQKSA